MKHVLFVCNHNAGRSQMAQAFSERLAPAVGAWDLPDPAGRPLEEVRAIRDAIELRVLELVETRLDAIRSDRTAHQLRLEHLLPDLVAGFEDCRTPEEVRACADAVLSRFADAPVRSHVLTLAHRRTRECLRAETCDVPAVA